MKKIYYLMLAMLISLSVASCTDDTVYEMETDQMAKQEETPFAKDATFLLKKDFATALAKVLSESMEVRGLIKEEALKKINYDFDVVYLLIKDKKLNNGKTLEGLLSEHLDINRLALIEQKLPTLTVFVPSLPEESFSAGSWDTSTEIPAVAISTFAMNDVPIVNSCGNDSIIPSHLIPKYPIVVVKENERIVTSTFTRSSDLQANSHLTIPVNKSGVQLQFINDSFNNLENKITTRTGTITLATPSPEIPQDMQKVFDAYDKYQNTDGWQRDYVYYDISPTNDRGVIKNEYKEFLCSFKMLGSSPRSAYDKISKPSDDDPRPYKGRPIPDRTDPDRRSWNWTDGEFEFEMKINVGTTHPNGSEQIVYFGAQPYELFLTRDVNSERDYVDWVVDSCLTYRLSVPLFTWDLEHYSPIIKITMSEIDNPTVVESVVETISEFAGNFELSGGVPNKIGMKFGASAKRTERLSYRQTTTYGNDNLGELYINFGDPILLGNEMVDLGSSYMRGGRVQHNYDYQPPYNSTYYTYWYKIEISPKKMY
ncbi:hypothetical protein [Bacteroides sp. UBA939]|uniref:hypothetical protein n=1 Tax=Bacteroides sp. UBA939 TaxID=1946092 RepID=UPI0025BE5B57|nr:hypothetical protein [Bacteroides sp. UBA939]